MDQHHEHPDGYPGSDFDLDFSAEVQTTPAPSPTPAVEPEAEPADLIAMVQEAVCKCEGDKPTADDIWQAQDLLRRIFETHKGLNERWKVAAEKYVKKNGEQRSGPLRMYLADKKKTVCLSEVETCKALFEKCGGSIDDVAAALKKNPFKPAAAKKVLGDDAKKYFQDQVEAKVTTEGGPKPVKKLAVADTRWIPRDDGYEGGDAFGGDDEGEGDD